MERCCGAMSFANMDGKEVSAGIILIGEPTPVAGTNFLRCLANVYGSLAVVELKLVFDGTDCPCFERKED